MKKKLKQISVYWNFHIALTKLIINLQWTLKSWKNTNSQYKKN